MNTHKTFPLTSARLDRRTIIKSIGALSAPSALGIPDAVLAAAATRSTTRTLKWGYSLPTRWDPVVSSTGADVFTMSLAYSGLTRIDEKGAAQPALAKSWKYNSDGTELTFTLRPNLKFADGTPVDADAVRQFILRAKATPGATASEPLETIQDVVADDPLTARFVLNRADYQLPLVLAGRPGLITSAAAAKAPDKLGKSPVGAGPFKITEVVPESYAYFVRDPNYWDAGNIFIDRVELYEASDKTLWWVPDRHQEQRLRPLRDQPQPGRRSQARPA